MECSNEKCSVTTNDRMVCCWLCTEYYHLKCTGGLKARDADALAEKGKFLQWTCPHCRKIGVEFYNMFKNSQNEFAILLKDCTALQSKLSKYGELFTKFPNLDSFAQPLSPKRKKTAGAPVIHPSMSNSPLLTPVNAIETYAPLPTTNHLNNVNNANNQIYAPLPTAVNNDTTTNYLNNVNALPTAYHINNVNNQTYAPLPIAVNNNTTTTNHIDDTTTNILNNVNQQTSSVNLDPANGRLRQLRVLPPKKAIFISRFAPETTVEDIEFYIKTKLNFNADIITYKFTYSQPRNVISFKLTVPFDLFENIIDHRFWPENTLVREYDFKENKRLNNIARLPSRMPNFQKN